MKIAMQLAGAQQGRSSSARPPLLQLTAAEEPTLVRDIMTADPYCASPDTRLDVLAARFLDQCISGAPVVDRERRPVGMVTKSDLLRHLRSRDTRHNAAAPSSNVEKFHAAFAHEIMTPVVFCLPDNASVSQAAALMAFEEVHQIPIANGEGRIVGVVSTLDVLRWMARREGYLIP